MKPSRQTYQKIPSVGSCGWSASNLPLQCRSKIQKKLMVKPLGPRAFSPLQLLMMCITSNSKNGIGSYSFFSFLIQGHPCKLKVGLQGSASKYRFLQKSFMDSFITIGYQVSSQFTLSLLMVFNLLCVVAFLWKYFVLLSPFFSHITLYLCLHMDFSCLSRYFSSTMIVAPVIISFMSRFLLS